MTNPHSGYAADSDLYGTDLYGTEPSTGEGASWLLNQPFDPNLTWPSGQRQDEQRTPQQPERETEACSPRSTRRTPSSPHQRQG